MGGKVVGMARATALNRSLVNCMFPPGTHYTRKVPPFRRKAKDWLKFNVNWPVARNNPVKSCMLSRRRARVNLLETN